MTASYWPFVDILRAYFAWSSEDDETKRAHLMVASLQEMVDRKELSDERFDEIGPLLGNLLSVRFGTEWDERLRTVDPQQMKNQTFLAINDFFKAVTKRAPVVLVFEDLHWADSLSLDLLSLLMDLSKSMPLCLLCVYRPEREHECWYLATIAERKAPERFTELHLRELNPSQGRQMVESLLQIESLPPSVREVILEKSQGNPFFVEEVIRSLIETGRVYREENYWRADENLEPLVVPESIQSVILSRVERLDGRMKHVLQRASVMGRLFKKSVLEALLEKEGKLDEILGLLEDNSLIYKERVIPELEYSFKHVLTQEAIYQSISPRHRPPLHGNTAAAMEKLFQENLDEHYEELAYHYSRSDKKEKALEYMFKAGDKAKRSSADQAALAYLRNGLEVLKGIPEGLHRTETELDYRVALISVLRAVKGYNSPESEDNLTKAQALCGQIGDTPHLFHVLNGLATFYIFRRNFPLARKYAKNLMEIARAKEDPIFLLIANLRMGSMLTFLGEYGPALEHHKQTIARYDSRNHYSLVSLYGPVDPGVQSLGWAARNLWYLGYPDQALRMIEKGSTLARELAHPYSVAATLGYASRIHRLSGSWEAFVVKNEEFQELTSQLGYTTLGDFAAVSGGLILIEQGQVEKGIAVMRRAVNAFQAREGSRWSPSDLMAMAYWMGGKVEEGLQQVDADLADVNKTDCREYEAELYRLRGELLLQKSLEVEAEASFQKAIAAARRQKAKSWELRATVRLAHLWQKQGKIDKARQQQGEIYNWFTEGFDTQDLKEAKNLLAELS